jgi:hypothetical protein
MGIRSVGPLLALLLLVPPAAAHPVPSQAHDCTVEIRLGEKAVVINYRLEIDETTAVLDLSKELSTEEVRKLDTPRACYEALLRVQGPLLAEGFQASVDGRKLSFICTSQRYQVLDHLRCDFVYSAPWSVTDGAPHRFTFRDDNYDQDAGRVRVSLAAEPGLTVADRSAADDALRSRPIIDLKPGDDVRLRRVSATVVRNAPSMETTNGPAATASDQGGERSVFTYSQLGLWLVLLMAAVLGYALRPRSRTGTR